MPWHQGYSRIAYPLSIYPTVWGNLTYKADAFGKADERMILHFFDGRMELYFDENNADYFYSFVLEQCKKDSKFMDKMEKHVKKIMKDLLNFSKKLTKMDLSRYSDDELVKLLNKFNDLYARIFGWGLVNTYDRDLGEYIKEYCIEKWGEKDGLHYFTILTSVIEETYYEQEKKDLLRAAQMYSQKKKKDEAIFDKLKIKYEWLYMNYEGEPRTHDDFKKIIKDILSQESSPQKVLELLEKKKRQLIREQKKLDHTLDIPWEMLSLIRSIRKNAYMREYRKPLAVQALFYERILLQEFAHRLNITVKELKFLLPDEIETSLKAGNINKEMIQERMSECVLDLRRDNYKFFVGIEAVTLLDEIKNKLVEKENVKGLAACPGYVTGMVRVIKTIKDAGEFKQGEIFVGTATSPELIQFLKKAAAIVTDEGGLTSHAAIVSRELHVPCIVGTRDATKIFKTGDEVEVDAKQGIVKKIFN